MEESVKPALLAENNGPDGFAARAAWLTGANILSFMLAFLTPLVIVRMLDQEEFGIYKQLFQILATVLMALNLQVGTSAYYFMPRVGTRQRQVAVNIILFYALAGLAVAVIFALWPGWTLVVFHNQEIVHHIPKLGLAIMLWLVAANLEAIPLSLGDIRAASVFIVVGQMLKSILILSAALIFQSVEAILWASIIEGLLQCVFMLGYVHRRLGSFWQPIDWSLFREQLANSLPFGSGNLVQGVQGDLHNYFVAYHFSPGTYAIYANGCFQMPLPGLLQSSFAAVLFPEVARLAAAGNHRAIVKIWLEAMRKLALLILPGCALMFVLREELIITLFTSTYAASVPIFAVYLINLALLTVMYGAIYRVYDEFRFFGVKLHLALIPVSALALWLGISTLGLLGAVVATVSVQVLNVSICVLVAARRIGLQRADLRELRPALRTLLATVMAGLLTWLVRLSLLPAHPILILVLCSLVFATIYLILAFATGAVTKDEKVQVMDGLQKLQRRFRFSAT